MPTLYAAADGRILELVPTFAETGLTLAPTTPLADIAASFVVDLSTNAALISDLIGARAAYRLNAGVLSREGTPVMVKAAGPLNPAILAAQNAATLRTRIVAQLDTLAQLATAALAASALPAPAVVTSLRTFAGGSTALTTAQLSAQLRILAGLVADEIDRRQQTQAALATQLIPAIRRTIRLAAGQLDAAD